MKDKLKCGIVTFHSSHNYGSVLQAYAMVKVMQRLGLDAELIDFRHPRTTDMYEWRLWSPYKNWKWNLRELVLRGLFGFGKKREQVFSDFIENVLVKSKRVKDKNDIPDIYDVLICGSDQIWNPKASGENDPIYYLDFGTTTCKFSYAASSGSVRFGDSNPTQFKKYLTNLKNHQNIQSNCQVFAFRILSLKYRGRRSVTRFRLPCAQRDDPVCPRRPPARYNGKRRRHRSQYSRQFLLNPGLHPFVRYTTLNPTHCHPKCDCSTHIGFYNTYVFYKATDVL